MKELLRSMVADAEDPLRAGNLVTEYLQSRILQFLQESGVFRFWIFHGGTALRFLYDLPRYSEDLDFALRAPDPKPDFESAVSKIGKWFEAETYHIHLKMKTAKTVKSSLISYPGLLYELGLSPRQTELLSIKIELDVSPPSGGKVESSVVRRHVVLNLPHYDKASLLSGKLHALLARPYLKGRDLYDIFWYLSDPSWPAPNIEFLNNALTQTKWKGPLIDEGNWTDVVEEKLSAIDWRRAVEDVRPFVERVYDVKMLTKENVFKLLKDKGSSL